MVTLEELTEQMREIVNRGWHPDPRPRVMGTLETSSKIMEFQKMHYQLQIMEFLRLKRTNVAQV